MPTEYYVGIAIALILICLLGLLIKPARSARPTVQQKRTDSDQLANQLSRIADSLEKLVAHLGASPPADKFPIPKPPIVQPPVEAPLSQELPVEKSATETPSIPVESPVGSGDVSQEKVDQPVERHVRLSMFGR
jgi:hypothetical protein